MLVLLGSHALNYYEEYKIPKDMDLVGTYDEVMSFAKSSGKITSCYPIAEGKKLVIKKQDEIIEAEIAWEGSVAEILINLIIADKSTVEHNGFLIPSLDVLYLLKMSHRYLRNSPHFLKTMMDIKRMRQLGAKIRPEHLEFFKLREKETYTYAHPNLNVTKATFFNGDNVEYIYDHDSIHEAMKHLDKPAYNYYKPDEKEVFCDKNLFFSVDEKIRLYGVLEEVYVLALERSQIPFGDTISPKKSFDIALMKLSTSISSGWFREFAWENFNNIQKLYDENYVSKFWESVKDKKVIKIS